MRCILLLLFISVNVFAQNKVKRVLFIGNSYVATNNLPLMLEQAALSAGDTLYTSAYTPGGYSFLLHSSDVNTIGQLQVGNWDRVVIQEQSQKPAWPDFQVQSDVYPYAKRLDSMINAFHSGCVQTVFYMTWGRKNGDSSNCVNFPPVCTYNGMDSLIRLRYLKMTNDNNAIVSPVGAVWKYIRVNHPTIELYSPDESHPSMSGTYAAACTFYATLLRKSPLNITYVPSGITAADAQIIRNAANRVVMDSLSTWKINAYDPDANFTYSTPSANTYLFNNTSTNATSYTWYFGDGSTSNVSSPLQVLDPSNATAILVAKNCFAVDSMKMSLTPFSLDEYNFDESQSGVIFYNLVGQKLDSFDTWNDQCNQFLMDHRNEILIMNYGGRVRKVSFR